MDVLLLACFPGWLVRLVAEPYLDYWSHVNLGLVCTSIRLDAQWRGPHPLRHPCFGHRLQHLACNALGKRPPCLAKCCRLLGLNMRYLAPGEPCESEHCHIGRPLLPAPATQAPFLSSCPRISVCIERVRIIGYEQQRLSTGQMAWTDRGNYERQMYNERWLSVQLTRSSRIVPCAATEPRVSDAPFAAPRAFASAEAVAEIEASVHGFCQFMDAIDRFPFAVDGSRRWKRRQLCRVEGVDAIGLAAKRWHPVWNRHERILTAPVGCPWGVVFGKMHSCAFDIVLDLCGFTLTRAGDGRQKLMLNMTIERLSPGSMWAQ